MSAPSLRSCFIASALLAVAVAVFVPVAASSEGKPLLFGGEYLSRNGESNYCSAGFNLERISDGKRFLVTAGHCYDVGDDVWDLENGWGDAIHIGTTTINGQSGLDMALVELHDTGAEMTRGEVLYDDDFDVHNFPDEILNGERIKITGIAEAEVGMEVCRTGGASGTHCGTVTALRTNSESGAVERIVTDICATGGDSGGPLFTRDGKAIGISNTADANCYEGGSGPSTYYPMTQLAEEYKVLD